MWLLDDKRGNALAAISGCGTKASFRSDGGYVAAVERDGQWALRSFDALAVADPDLAAARPHVGRGNTKRRQNAK
jgi:hypothetical protein